MPKWKCTLCCGNSKTAVPCYLKVDRGDLRDPVSCPFTEGIGHLYKAEWKRC